MDDVERFLICLDLQQYYPTFQRAQVSWEKLLSITPEELKELHVPLPARRRILEV
jgi:hypothetical protein